jgi:transposase
VDESDVRINPQPGKSNLDTFYQLELLTRYKAIRAGVPVESVPAPYTSKSDHRNGVIGKRNGGWFRGFDGYRCNADWNASQNIGQ